MVEYKMLDKELKNYEINEMIDYLSGIRGSQTELISLYIPYNKSRSDVIKYLKKEVENNEFYGKISKRY